jgi:hypothetical protein
MTLLIGRSKNNGLTPHIKLCEAFTLLEVLLSAVILAVCIVAIFGAFISCFEARLRAENYAKALLISLDKLEPIISSETFTPSSDSEEIIEDIRRFKCQFSQSFEISEDYPELKAISLQTTWEQGRREGRLSFSTYYWETPK